jgi:hypothetical protein
MAEEQKNRDPKPATDRTERRIAGGRGASAEHSQGGTTTRDDALDLGVPMLPGDPAERQGPEDALGEGPKRGDYAGRIGPAGYHPHETLPVAEPEPDGPRTVAVPQRPRAEEVGDEARLKGGVDTAKGRV